MMQNKITQYQLMHKPKFNYKRIIFLFIAVIFLSVFLYSVKAHALEFETSIPSQITLYNKPVDVWFTIKNTSDASNLYNFKLYTSPFASRIDIQSLRLNIGETRQVKLTIYPLENTANQEYTSTLEVSENQLIHFYSIKIVQLTNKICSIEVDDTVDYLVDSNRYHLDLKLTNNSDAFQTINLNKFQDLNADQFTEMSVGLYPKEEKHINYYIDTNKSSLEISYVCNNLFQKKNIDFPNKPIINENNNGTGISGYFTFTNFKTNISAFLKSITLQIILIIIIILLAITFASRYIRLIHLHNIRRRM
ncbi:MAG: hypothetical protein WCF78_00595 [archaeon]